MSFIQVITPNTDDNTLVVNSGGVLLRDWYGMCLAVVRSAFGLPPHGATAWDCYQNYNQRNHPDRNWPVGVYFPIWFSGYGGSGHVAIAYINPLTGGMSIDTSPYTHKPYFDHYTNVDALAKGYGVVYAGWSEDIAGAVVIQDIPAPAPVVTPPTPTPSPADPAPTDIPVTQPTEDTSSDPTPTDTTDTAPTSPDTPPTPTTPATPTTPPNNADGTTPDTASTPVAPPPKQTKTTPVVVSEVEAVLTRAAHTFWQSFLAVFGLSITGLTSSFLNIKNFSDGHAFMLSLAAAVVAALLSAVKSLLAKPVEAE